MNSSRSSEETNCQDTSTTCGVQDKKIEFGTEHYSLSTSLSTLWPSSLIHSYPAMCVGVQGHTTSKIKSNTSIEPGIDLKQSKYATGFFKLIALAVGILIFVPTMIAIKDVSSSSLSENYTDSRSMHSSFPLHHWTQTHQERVLQYSNYARQRRFLQNTIDAEADSDSVGSTNDEKPDEAPDDSLEQSVVSETEAPAIPGLDTIEVKVDPGVNASDPEVFDELVAKAAANSTDESDQSQDIDNISAREQNLPNQTEAPTIPGLDTVEITIDPGVNASDPDVVDGLITEATANNTGEPDQPEALDVTNPPSSSFTPTLSPTITYRPSSSPSISSQPTFTAPPSTSVAPSFGPSDVPSTWPSVVPTTTFSPSVSPSTSPTATMEPSRSPTRVPSSIPTQSVMPSSLPSESFQPTMSFSPSESPSESPTASPTLVPTSSPTRAQYKVSEEDLVMELQNVPEPFDNQTIITWQHVTSRYMVEFFGYLHGNYSSDFPFNITSVETTAKMQQYKNISQNFVEGQGEKKENEDNSLSARNDTSVPNGQLISDLSTEPEEVAGTYTINITYNQDISYEIIGDNRNMTDEEQNQFINQLFLLPFTTSSFHYSMELVEAMNWSTWVNVKAVEVKPVTPPEPGPALARLNIGTTLAISLSIIFSACLIVAYLLWDRTKKVGTNKCDESSIGFSVHGTPSRSGPVVGQGGIWGPGVYYNNDDNGNVKLTVDEEVLTSVRSAPAHLRRNLVDDSGAPFDERRGRSVSRESLEGRRTHKSTGSASSNADRYSDGSPKPFPTEVIRYGGTPKQNSTTSERIIKNQPYLPPLPPPSAFGSSSMHGRVATNESLDESSLSLHVALNDTKNNGRDNERDNINRPPSTAFRRPSRSLGMRISNLTDVSMTDLSFMTDAFGTERSYSDAYTNANQRLNEPSPTHANQTRPEQFRSPLHLPDESAGVTVIDPILSNAPESPIPTMATMLGLESRPIDDATTPA